MSGKRRRLKINLKRNSKRGADRLTGIELAVINAASAKCGGPVHFVDVPFTCIDCGKSEIWSAQQQEWYYSVAKGSLYATAVRCRECRKLRARTNDGMGDPNPIKHEGTLIKRVQSALAPAIAEAGFEFISKTALPTRGSISLDYSRDDLVLNCWYDRPNATLIAETMDRSATYTQIAKVPFSTPRSGSQIVDRIATFCAAVTQHLLTLPPAKPER